MRIKTRVRTAMAAQAARGPLPRRPAAVRLPARRRRPAPEPEQGRRREAAAPARARPDRRPGRASASSPSTLAGRGLFAIAEGLTADGIPPVRPRPGRNRHRHGQRRWGSRAVRAILANPRYTGLRSGTSSARTRCSSTSRTSPSATRPDALERQDDWVWSAEPAHEALVDRRAVRRRPAAPGVDRQARRPSPAPRKRPALPARPASCRAASAAGGCRAHWNHDRAYYRCQLPVRVRRQPTRHHPHDRLRARGAPSSPASTGGWPALFDRPPRRDVRCAGRRQQARPDDRRTPGGRLAGHQDCDRPARPATAQPSKPAPTRPRRRLDRRGPGRAAPPPERVARVPRSPAAKITKDHVRALVEEPGRPRRACSPHAEPRRQGRASTTSWAITLTYHPDGRVAVEARPACASGVCRRGDLNPHALNGH